MNDEVSQGADKLIERQQHWELPIIGRGVDHFEVSSMFKLVFEGGADLVIEQHFTISERETEQRFDASHDRDGLGGAFQLWSDTVARAVARKSGTLTVTFKSGRTLTVPPHPRYEAWNFGWRSVLDPKGILIVCMPGGDLAVWSN